VIPTLAEIARYMRMGTRIPEGELAARVTALRDAVCAACGPRRVFRRMARSGLDFASEKLARHLEGCRDVYLVCGTLGTGFDAFLRRVSVASGVDALAVQAIGAAAVEKFVDACEDEIRRELAPEESLAPRYSPGYGDFPLAANRAILDLLDAPRRVGVSLTDTLLLVPSKTVTAVIGVRAPGFQT